MQVIQTPYVVEEKNKHVGKVLSGANYEIMNIQLKKGEKIPTHHADCDVLIIVRSGTVLFTVEEEKVELSSENILQMNPFEKHSLESLEDADLLVLKIK